MKELKEEIELLKKGFEKIATEVGKTRGELEQHKKISDAHNPAMISRNA
jgi:hypothetical protein